MRRRFRIGLSSILLVSLAAVAVGGQEFSERREIALFRLSYYGQPEPVRPSGAFVRIEVDRTRFAFEYRGTGRPSYDALFRNAFDAVDERIRGVFVNLGRFDVVGYPQRLRAEHVDDFIQAIREYRTEELEMPEAVMLGQQAFTEAEFRELSGGFLVIVPSVTWYRMDYNRSEARYAAEIETSFTVVDVDSGRTVEHFRVETSGNSDRAERAVQAAVDGIPARLEYQVRSRPTFRLRSGIIDRDGLRIYMEFGRNMGVRRGDEYAVMSTHTGRTGYTDEYESGLIVVSDVYEQYSVGRLIYGGSSTNVGDQLEEVPRRGAEVGAYAHMLLSPPGGGRGVEPTGAVIGLSAVANRGFFRFRPLLALELPLTGERDHTVIGGYLGFETSFYAGRLRFGPAFKLGGAVADRLGSGDDSDPFVSHLGGKAQLGVNFQLGRDTMLGVQTGWMQLWRSGAAAGTNIRSVVGPYVGATLTFR